MQPHCLLSLMLIQQVIEFVVLVNKQCGNSSNSVYVALCSFHCPAFDFLLCKN